jgi:hypothetical protein
VPVGGGKPDRLSLTGDYTQNPIVGDVAILVQSPWVLPRPSRCECRASATFVQRQNLKVGYQVINRSKRG